MEMKFWQVYLWCIVRSALCISAIDVWTPVSVNRALSVTRGGQIDLRPAIAFTDQAKADCNVQFIARDHCGRVEPTRFSCNSYSGPILYQHFGCLSERELATFLVSSRTEIAANVSTFSVEITIEALQLPTSEITMELIESDHESDSVLEDEGTYNYRIVFPTALIGRCHYEVVTNWPHLSLPSSGTLIGVSNQPLPCGFMAAGGLTYVPNNSSSLVTEDHLLIRVHNHNKYGAQNQFIILPMKLELAENTSAVHVLPTQQLIVRQGANTPIPASLLTFSNSSPSLHLNNSQHLYHYTFPVPINAGSFRSILSLSANVSHTTFTNRELLKGNVAFYPYFSAPLLMVFRYNISNSAGVVIATGEISVFVQSHDWEWPVQRTNRPLEVMEGGSSIFDHTLFDFYLQADTCMQHATMTAVVPPEHGHMMFLNGSTLGDDGVLIGVLKNGTVLVYNHTDGSEDLTDSITWEVSCPGGFVLQVFTSILIAPRHDLPTVLTRGQNITVHRSWAMPLSPSAIFAYNVDSPLDKVVVTVSQSAGLVKIDWDKLSVNDITHFPPFIKTETLLTRNVTEEVSNFTLSDLEDYSIWYVPPTDTSLTNQFLTFSIDDSTAAIQVDLVDLDLNQTLFFSTQGEYPSVPHNLPLPLHTHTGTFITSSYLYSQAIPHSPEKVVYLVHSRPANGLLCLLSGEKCRTSISRFTQRDINSQRVFYKQNEATAAGSIKEDSFGFELTVDGFHQHTAILHQFHFKPVQTAAVSVAMDRTFYVNAGRERPIAPRHFRPFSNYLNSKDITFHVLRRPHYGSLKLNGTEHPSSFTFRDLLGRKVVYLHYQSAMEACSDQFTFSVGNSTHSVEGTMHIAIRRGREDIHVQVVVGQHTLFPEQRKFVFGSEDINVSSSFCLEYVMFTLNSLPSMGVLTLVDNKYNTVIQLEENSTFTANDIYSGFLHYTFTDQAPVENQTSDGFNLAASDPTSSWPSDLDRQGDGVRTTGHFHVIIIPLPNEKHELAINITSPGFLSWLPSYRRYGYIFSDNDIIIYNSTIEPHQVVIQLDREPEFGSIWKGSSMDNIFTVEDVNNGLVWYQSDVRLTGFSSDSFQMSIVINLMDFSMLVEREEFTIEWATIQLQNTTLRVSESAGQVEIVVRRTGALWFESQVLLTTKPESAKTNAGCRPPADFCNVTQTLVFPVDTTEKIVIVPIDDDDMAEDTETFLVDLSDPSNAVIDENQNHTKIWINDISDYSIITMVGGGITGNGECSHVTRVDEWVGRANITLRRTGNLQQRVGVVCYTLPQSTQTRATEFSDYIPRRQNWSNSTVWFEVNQVEANCDIAIINDANAEIKERFYVQLHEEISGRGVLGEPGAVHCVEINNERDDWPEVNFTTQEMLVRESETSDVFVPIIIKRTGPDLSVVTLPDKLQWLRESREDEATFGLDFDLPDNESCTEGNPDLSCVTFAPGQTTAMFHVIIKHDRILEPNESFHLVLNSPYRVNPYSMKVTILESAPPAVIGFAQRITRLDEYSEVKNIPIVRTGYLNSSVAVYCRVKGAPSYGNATSPTDFITSARPSRVVFREGDTEQACNLYVVDDNVWEGPETLRVELELGLGEDPNESLGAEISVEKSSTIVVIDDVEDIPTVEFQETSYDATEPLSNFDIDRIVATLNLTRKGDLSYTTAVRYEIMADRASFQPPRDPGQEVVFHPQETVKEIKIELRANHQSDENENVYVNLVEGRVLDNVSVPAAVGQLKLSVIRVRNQEYRGPFFPDLPAVANNGEPISAIAVGKLYYDLPLLCITPCSSQYLANSERLNSSRLGCASQNISQESTVYSWEVSQDNNNFTTMEHATALTNAHSERLDTFYLKPDLYVRCSAQAVSYTGVRGHTRTSRAVFLGGERYSCNGSGGRGAKLTSYSSFGGHDKDLLRLTVRVPHIRNTIPVLSTHPILANTTESDMDGHRSCSTLLPQSSLSWMNNEPLYSHLDRERCLWEFSKWLPVEDWLERCGGQRSSHSAMNSITITVHSTYMQYDSPATLASKQSIIVGQINYSTSSVDAFLPTPLHTLPENRENTDAYIFPIAIEQEDSSVVVQVYFYSVLPLGPDREMYRPVVNSTTLALLHRDMNGNTTKQVWLLEIGTMLPTTLPMEFQPNIQPSCEVDCASNDDDGSLKFSLAVANDRGTYRLAFRARVTLQHVPDVDSNGTKPFALGERVYIMFDLDPSLEIQPNFMFAVSELRLCQHTVAAVSPTTTEPCSNQHWIVTGVAMERGPFDVLLQHREHTVILQFSTSPINVEQSSSQTLWYLDLSYGISTNNSIRHKMVVTEHTILNISIDLSLPATTNTLNTVMAPAPQSKHFLYAAVAILVVALVITAIGFTVIGVLVWTTRMKTQIEKKVQTQLEAQRASTSRKNSVALNNKKKGGDEERGEEQTLRRTQSTIGFPTREKLKRIKSKKSTTTAERAEVSTAQGTIPCDAGARAVTSDEGASVQPSKLSPTVARSIVTRARSLPNLTMLETQTSEGFFMGEPQPRKLHFQTTVSKVNTERWHLNKWAQHHIKANRQLETARTIHDLATRRRNYGANESKQNLSLNKDSHNELARYAVRSLAASAKTPEPEKGPRTKL